MRKTEKERLEEFDKIQKRKEDVVSVVRSISPGASLDERFRENDGSLFCSIKHSGLLRTCRVSYTVNDESIPISVIARDIAHRLTSDIVDSKIMEMERIINIDEQVRIIESQLSCFDSLMDKMRYLTEFFGPDPEFSREAMDIVRGNISKGLKSND